MSKADERDALEKRIIALEEGMMHNDHLLTKLNEVICQLQDRLDEQSRQFKLLQETIERSSAADTEERSFEDERPPHY